MSESATEAKLRDLGRQLSAEKTAHARTRNELQATIERIWRLVPGYWINLMGVYPSLRRLVHILAEAADLQDPARGAAYEDTMRTEYTPDGETLTQTERGVIHHQRARDNVRQLEKGLIRLNKELEYHTHRMGGMIPGSHWEYEPPEGKCEVCGELIVQSDTGRARRYCGDTCRQRAKRARHEMSRNVAGA